MLFIYIINLIKVNGNAGQRREEEATLSSFRRPVLGAVLGRFGTASDKILRVTTSLDEHGLGGYVILKGKEACSEYASHTRDSV